MRADAARNRLRVLEAARELFAEQGRDVQMEDIARRAGVGVGTLYRHFPTKEALVAAVADYRWQEVLATVREAAANDDAFEALRQVFAGAGRIQARDRGFCVVMEETFGSDAPTGDAKARLREQLGAIVERAKASGDLRADVDTNVLPTVFCGLSSVVRNGLDWQGYLDIVLAGLRAPAK